MSSPKGAKKKKAASYKASSMRDAAASDSASSANDDPRMGDIIKKHSERPGQLVLVGFPHDEGVKRNGGRVGAARGPKCFRALLPRVGCVVNPEHGVDLSTLLISDAGDVGGDCASLEEAHEKLRAQVSALIADNRVPFVVGGGNDQSYPNAAALMDQYGADTIGAINIDAHLDVRPLKDGRVHSGSPFRQLLEDERFDGHQFVEFAVQGNQCSMAHADFVKRHKGRLVWMSNIRHGAAAERFKEELDDLSRSCQAIFVSFDIDAIVGADAPGVSAVATYGLTAREALEMCMVAGQHEKVQLMDVSEYNPTVEEYRTGRLVGNMFYFFALGLAKRFGRTGLTRI